jgi:ABC-type transport system involved in cytochrome bd biosynthesis fused ATPase/permease subunit
MTARANPFRAQCVDALKFQPQNAAWQEIMARLETLNFRAAIIGKHGRGKTTLLENLAPLLHARGRSTYRLQLNSSKRIFSACQWREISALGPRDVILLDGAEQLARWRWKVFQSKTRRAGGLMRVKSMP